MLILLIWLSFSALQRAENSSMLELDFHSPSKQKFQCSSASRKFLNAHDARQREQRVEVSVLFSEPKIPQCGRWRGRRCGLTCFSALQRAENSSIPLLFSSSQHAPSFSALQRAENSSIGKNSRLSVCRNAKFQCSSASRKFLNEAAKKEAIAVLKFQCSSASRKFLNPRPRASARLSLKSFSALQRAENSSMHLRRLRRDCAFAGFSALQRAENSSISAGGS